MATCSHCQVALAPEDRFCRSCGAPAPIDGADLPLSAARAHASELLNRGDVDRAIALLEPHALAEDADANATFALGAAYMQRARYLDAIPLLERTTRDVPTHARAQAYLAMAYLHTYRLADAREAIDVAIALEPADFVVNLKHGELLMRLGYYRECIGPLERALATASPDASSLAFARRLMQLAREKAPNTFTRPVSRLPRWSLLRRIRESGRQDSPPASVNFFGDL